MESLYLNTVVTTGYLDPGVKGQGFIINDVSLDVPLNASGATDPSVTFSGVWSGSYTFHNSISPELRFKRNESISISSSLPANHSASIKYIRYGSDDAYTDKGTRAGMDFIPLSTWESSKVEPTGIL